MPKDLATTLVSQRLDARGKLCLAGPAVWPLDVAKAAVADKEKRPKVLRQLEALQKVGLVEAHDGFAWKLDGEKYVKSDEAVTRYSISDFGRHFLRVQPSSAAEKAAGIEHGDLCYATMALDKVVDIGLVTNVDKYRVTTVRFTYKTPIVVPWVKDPAIQEAYAASLKSTLSGVESTALPMPLVKIGDKWSIFEPASSTDVYHVRH
ncbi:hypothetical protein AS149_14880 [Burkholderia cenocepacia]|nr:hypothetical protein AS149_14880 [Burkholderia cenocepacia]